MTRALYLIGPPGVGKSTVTDALIERWTRSLPHRLHRLLWGEHLHNPLDPLDNPQGVYLGEHREKFSGTDALGMAVQPDAIGWVEDEVVPMCLDPYRDGSAPRVIGEGARLGNAPFLTVFAKHADLTVIHLSAASGILDARCAARGSQQSETWRKGAATRALRAAERLDAAGVHVVDVAADRPLPEVVARVRDESGW